jgi:hypothetical protein
MRSRRSLFGGEKQMSELIPFDLEKQVMYLHPDSDAAIALKSVNAFTTEEELRLVTETLEDAYWGNLAKEKLYVSESMGTDTFERQLQDIVSKKRKELLDTVFLRTILCAGSAASIAAALPAPSLPVVIAAAIIGGSVGFCASREKS